MTPQLHTLAAIIVKERDRSLEFADRIPELPTLTARYQGMAAAYDLTLAAIAAFAGLPSRGALESAVADEAVPA